MFYAVRTHSNRAAAWRRQELNRMKSQFGHLQINIDPANLGFYRDLFSFLEWTPYADTDEMLGVGDANGGSLWFGTYESNGKANDYDGIGVNHIGIAVSAQKDVDAAADY